MKLYNTLSRRIEEFKPLHDKGIRMYSCGPTVYDHIHIGNLSSFIYADTLRRVLQASGYAVEHVMNFTDVDDKTIRRSREQYPDLAPQQALQKLTHKYAQLFLSDMEAIGNNVGALKFVRATERIEDMQKLIRELYKGGFAYIADDGVYFSIEKYKKSGKKYGQLLELQPTNTSEARINNDEYDKESVHDFALWKRQKDDEPAWEFELDGHDLIGRPGWHIECSAMSVEALGQPFDIHTGGVDLIFPHHENEIAQSTAGKDKDFAKVFFHNEHLLVDSRKMSKSLNNFYTLQDVKEHGFNPLAFRLLVLQSHYRSQSNFTWENLQAANQRLARWRGVAALRHQATAAGDTTRIKEVAQKLQDAVAVDINTPKTLQLIDELFSRLESYPLNKINPAALNNLMAYIDNLLGLKLKDEADISDNQKQLIKDREKARSDKDFAKSDELRGRLEEQGIAVRDTEQGPIWYRL